MTYSFEEHGYYIDITDKWDGASHNDALQITFGNREATYYEACIEIPRTAITELTAMLLAWAAR